MLRVPDTSSFDELGRKSDPIATRFKRASEGARGAMAVNFSAWSIRNPLPPIILTAAILRDGHCRLQQAAGHADAERRCSRHFGNGSRNSGQHRRSSSARVTKAVEDASARASPALAALSSTITDGISRIPPSRSGLETDTDRALNDVKDAVTTSAPFNLPRGIDEPMIQRVDIASLPILIFTAIAPGKTPRAGSPVRGRRGHPRVARGPRGPGPVDRIGSVEREIRVGLTGPAAIGRLTPLLISRQLRGKQRRPRRWSGRNRRPRPTIRTLAGAKTVADLAAVRIALPAGGEVRLDDLGLITDTIAEPRTFARFDGAPVVGFNILRAKGASDVVLADAIAARIDAIKAATRRSISS